jgi:hypothetical protein
MKYILTHLGLGDAIICNGLVRHFANKFGSVILFVDSSYVRNIKHMYRDNENIKFFPVKHYNDAIRISREIINKKDLIVVGYEKLSFYKNSKFDEAFYLGCGLKFENRFTNFKFVRDLEREEKLYNRLNPNNEKYIFTHNVDLSKVRSDLKIIENPEDSLIFDTIKLLENAEEIHVMESSVKCLINSYKLDKPKLFYHQYVREYGEYNNSKGLNKFIEIR